MNAVYKHTHVKRYAKMIKSITKATGIFNHGGYSYPIIILYIISDIMKAWRLSLEDSCSGPCGR